MKTTKKKKHRKTIRVMGFDGKPLKLSKAPPSEMLSDTVDNVFATASLIPISRFLVKQSEHEKAQADMKERGLECLASLPMTSSINLINNEHLVSRDHRISQGHLPEYLSAQIKGFDLLLDGHQADNVRDHIFRNFSVRLVIGQKIYFECPLEMYRESPTKTRYHASFENKVNLISMMNFGVELSTSPLILPDTVVAEWEKDLHPIKSLLHLNVLLTRPVQ